MVGPFPPYRCTQVQLSCVHRGVLLFDEIVTILTLAVQRLYFGNETLLSNPFKHFEHNLLRLKYIVRIRIARRRRFRRYESQSYDAS